MKYYVRTTGERDLSQYSVLEYTPLYDYEHRPVESYIEQLRLISDDDAVLLEDDVILCKDFQNKIEDVISNHKHQIINFYQCPTMYHKPMVYPAKMFMWNQCIYYPKGIGSILADEMERLLSIKKYKQYDMLEADALYNLHINFYVHKPLLVKHIGRESLIGNNPDVSEALFFIDDLEDAGLDYNDVQTMREIERRNRTQGRK